MPSPSRISAEAEELAILLRDMKHAGLDVSVWINTFCSHHSVPAGGAIEEVMARLLKKTTAEKIEYYFWYIYEHYYIK